MAMDRHCDKCNLEVPHGTVLSTLCVDSAAHHLVDNFGGKESFIVIVQRLDLVFSYLW